LTNIIDPPQANHKYSIFNLQFPGIAGSPLRGDRLCRVGLYYVVGIAHAVVKPEPSVAGTTYGSNSTGNKKFISVF